MARLSKSGGTSIMDAVKIKRVALCGHPVGGEVIVTDSPSLTSPAASLPFSLVEVLPLERLRLREGPFRILHFLELLRDQLHPRVHEVPDRRPDGLRSAREIVDFHEEIEGLQVPRGQAECDFFRVRIPQICHPTRGSIVDLLTDRRRTELSRAIQWFLEPCHPKGHPFAWNVHDLRSRADSSPWSWRKTPNRLSLRGPSCARCARLP